MVKEYEYDLFGEQDLSDENVEDALADKNDLKNSVLYHTDWTVETIIGQLKKKRIDINPSFQRRDAWNIKSKSLLIESIILNYPIPAITLAEHPDTKVLIVVDGKQRLNTLMQFFGEQPESPRNLFKLGGLPQLSELNGLGISDIEEKHPKYLAQIENYTIRTNILRGWKNDSILYSIFHRLNSGSVKLSPQELRQSLHPGPFTNFITDYSEKSVALRDMFPGSDPDFRMRDVELVTRYLAMVFYIEDYNGDLKGHLDHVVLQLNSDWNYRKEDVEKALDLFEKNYQIAINAFSRKNAFRKWNGDAWEPRSNRAVFDSVMFNLLSDDVAHAFVTRPDDVVEAFKSASNKADFRNAVERTTKKTEALYNRIRIFGDELSKIGVQVPAINISAKLDKILVS